jgi:hypothetical protein
MLLHEFDLQFVNLLEFICKHSFSPKLKRTALSLPKTVAVPTGKNDWLETPDPFLNKVSQPLFS